MLQLPEVNWSNKVQLYCLCIWAHSKGLDLIDCLAMPRGLGGVDYQLSSTVIMQGV